MPTKNSMLMNKITIYFFTFIMLFLMWNISKAQVIFLENFNSGGMPSTFTLIDNDGLTPAGNVSYFTNAWIVRGDFGNAADSVAASTSWYDPAGASDDWMITPAIQVGQNAELRWNARAVDADYPDGYQVLISTTGTAINDFTDTIFFVTAENPSWTEHVIDLMAEGYADTTIYIAFRNNSDDMFILLIDDIKVRTVPAQDVTITYIVIAAPSCNLTSTESVTITLKNTGLNDVSNFPVSYTVNSLTPVSETFTNTIQPGATANYTFIQQADFSVKNTVFSVQAFSALSGDGDATNDTSLIISTINVASSDVDANAYTTSFETTNQILGWQVEDVNNDGSSWGLRGQPYDGNYSFMYLYNENASANDWLYSTCLDVTANTAYKMNFFYKVGNAQGTVYPEKFSVHYGNAQTATAMTNLIRDFGTVNNDAYEEAAVAFKPATSGTQYIGIKCYSDADQFYLAVDQITIDVLQAPVASFTHVSSNLSVAFTAPSGTDLFNTLSWDFGDDTVIAGNGSGMIHTYAQYGTYNVCLTVTNLAGTDTYCDSVTLQPTGIKTLNQNIASIYPNPTNGFLNITFNSNKNSVVTVSDIVGTVVLQENTTAINIMQLNLSSLPNGVYFIKTEQDGKTDMKKVMLAK
jgi:PKD repeat protein